MVVYKLRTEIETDKDVVEIDCEESVTEPTKDNETKKDSETEPNAA